MDDADDFDEVTSCMSDEECVYILPLFYFITRSSDSPPPSLSPKNALTAISKKRATPAPLGVSNTNVQQSPHQTRAVTRSPIASKHNVTPVRKPGKPARPNNNVATPHVPSNTNQRQTTLKSEIPRGPNNNTPPSSPRAEEQSSVVQPKRKQKATTTSAASKQP